MNKRIEAAYERRPRRWVFELAVAVVVVALLIWSGSAVETAGTTQNGAVIAWNILAGIFHPDTDLLFNFTTQGVPYLLLETICIAFLGTIVGAIISVPLAFLSASNLTPKPVAFVGRIIIMAVRTVPAFVYGLMFIRVTGPGAFAGLAYTFDLRRPVGSRVVRLTKLDGSPLENGKFRLCTSNYRATGTGGYDALRKCPVLWRGGVEMPDLTARYIQTHSPVPLLHNVDMQVIW